MCEESVVLYPPYICAYVGSVIVLFSLIHFLVCITANYAHIKKDRLLAPHGGETGSSLHGEKMAAVVAAEVGVAGTEKGARSPETLERIRDDVMTVFKTDLSVESEKNPAYVPSDRIQHDLVNYWLR